MTDKVKAARATGRSGSRADVPASAANDAPPVGASSPATLGSDAGLRDVAGGGLELISDLPIDQIAVEPGFNPRQDMDEQELDELTSSVALHGLLQPILVRPRADQPGWLLTGGHRRYEAARRAGLKTVPAIVRRTGDALVAAVLDNSHRVDLTPLEEAMTFARAMQEKGLTARGVAETFSVSSKRVTERLRILDTPEPVQRAIGSGTISVQQVPWYAELMAKAPALATAIGAADVKAEGRLDRQGIQQVIRSTKGIIDAGEIVVGTAFEVRSDAVRNAVDALAKVDAVYSDPDYEWRHGPGRGFPQVRQQGSHPATVTPTDAMLEHGEAVGAVVQIPTGSGWRPLAAIVDPAWLQQELERELVAAHESLQQHRRSARSSARSKDDSTLTPNQQREREQRRAEREQQVRDREQARELNARLGPALLNHLAAVELTMDSAKALCLLLLQPVERYGTRHDDVAALAGAGLRYVLPDWQLTETSRGKPRPALICDRAELAERFWAWWNGARTPQEVLGRTLIAFAAAHYADERQAFAKERLYGGGLPGHPEARKHLEALIDAKMPTALRKRRRRARRQPAAKPAATAPSARTQTADDAGNEKAKRSGASADAKAA